MPAVEDIALRVITTAPTESLETSEIRRAIVEERVDEARAESLSRRGRCIDRGRRTRSILLRLGGIEKLLCGRRIRTRGFGNRWRSIPRRVESRRGGIEGFEGQFCSGRFFEFAIATCFLLSLAIRCQAD